MPLTAANIERIIGRRPNGGSIANLPATLPKAREPKPQADPADLQVLQRNLKQEMPNSFGSNKAGVQPKPVQLKAVIAKVKPEKPKPIVPNVFAVKQLVFVGTPTYRFRVLSRDGDDYSCCRTAHHQVPGAIQTFNHSQLQPCI